MDIPIISDALNLFGAPSLKDFYENFNESGNDPTYTLNQTYRFCVWMWPDPIFSTTNPLSYYMASEWAKNPGSFMKFLTFFTQKIELPSLTTRSEDTNTSDSMMTDFGYMSYPDKFMLPSKPEFTLKMLDTEVSPLDHLFNVWLGQTTSQVWCYPDKPFTTATFLIYPFNIDKAPLTDITIPTPNQIYMFFRCFPTEIGLPDFDATSMANTVSLRDVKFRFSKMVIFPNVPGIVKSLASTVLNLPGKIF